MALLLGLLYLSLGGGFCELKSLTTQTYIYIPKSPNMAQESRLKTKHRGLLIESRFPYWECLGLLVASSNNKKKIAHTFRIILV